MIVFDTYAWIEYFLGSKKGENVKSILEEDNILTPSLVLVELSVKSAKEGWDFEKHLEFIKSKSLIVGINGEIIKQAGGFYVAMRKKNPSFGLIDALIFLVAKEHQAKIITGDPHFKNLENVEFLE